MKITLNQNRTRRGWALCILALLVLIVGGVILVMLWHFCQEHFPTNGNGGGQTNSSNAQFYMESSHNQSGSTALYGDTLEGNAPFVFYYSVTMKGTNPAILLQLSADMAQFAASMNKLGITNLTVGANDMLSLQGAGYSSNFGTNTVVQNDDGSVTVNGVNMRTSYNGPYYPGTLVTEVSGGDGHWTPIQTNGPVPLWPDFVTVYDVARSNALYRVRTQ